MKTASGLALTQALAAAALLSLLSGCNRGASSYPDFADVVESASPSVVNISTVPQDQDVVAAEAPAPSGDPEAPAAEGLENAPEWFRKFFDEHAQSSDEEDQGPETSQSLGSGFVLWEDGYIITNYHVIRDAKEITVRLLDRRQLPAQIVGSDERSDLALLKIDAKDLPAVKIGDSTKLRPGQWVLAIGSPFGFDYSVTAGIVSAKGRNLISEQYVPFIQTDVAINPGNSGGPLFNLKGEVVGVNSQIYSQSGGYQGVSFSIPIDVAAKVAQQLKDRGKVTRGWLGVVVQEVDRALAQNFGMEKPVGALVARIIADSPAERAGVRAGDVILSYNGVELQTSQALPPMVGSTDPGEIVSLQIMRDGKQILIKVEAGTLANENPEVAEAPTPEAAEPPLGLVVSALTADERREAQVLSGGVKVESVRPGPGARAGLRPGDVILSIAGQDVDSASRYAEVVARLTPNSSVPMLVQRNGAPSFLALEVPSKPAG